MALEARREAGTGLVDLVDRILDKGLVINADITVAVAGVELLGIKIRAALASFETAAQCGLEFPSGINYQKRAWEEAEVVKKLCPGCERKVPAEELSSAGCPWCGWMPAQIRDRNL